MNRYYIYALVDPRNNLPFYIGKGKDRRALTHLIEGYKETENKKKYAYIKGLRNKKLEPVILMLQENIEDENEAYNLEIYYIKKYGRKDIDDGGILTNILIDQRPPDNKGRKHTKQARKNMSSAKKGDKNPMWNKKEELHHNYQKPGLSGIDNPFYGKTHSEEQKEKWKNMERGMSGKKHTEKTKKKMRKARKNQIITEETKRKISRSLRDRKQSEETKKKRSETIKQWWKERKKL